MADLPLWISTDQADRLKAQLEAAGFVNVVMETDDDDLLVRVFTGTDDGPEMKHKVGNVMGLSRVVGHFQKLKETRRG